MKIKKPTTPQDKIIFAFLGIVGLAVLAYLSLVAHERYRFYQAEKEIDNLYSQIISITNKPDQVEKYRRCNYSSAKFSRGRLTCSTQIRFEYDNLNSQESNKLVSSITSRLNLTETYNSGVRIFDKSTLFIDRADYFENTTSNQNLVQDIQDFPRLRCNLTYTLNSLKKLGDNLEYEIQTPKLSISIGCYMSDPLFEHFSVKDV